MNYDIHSNSFIRYQKVSISLVTILCSIHTFFYQNLLLYKKLVLGQPNGQETFSDQATEVRNLHLCLSSSYYTFEETVTNFEKEMFRNESLTYFKPSVITGFLGRCKFAVYRSGIECSSVF